jgi:hypothetical protein
LRPDSANRPSRGTAGPGQHTGNRPNPGNVKPGARPNPGQAGGSLGTHHRPGGANIGNGNLAGRGPTNNRPAGGTHQPGIVNNNIHHRPGGQNLDPQKIRALNDKWHNAIANNPARPGHGVHNGPGNRPGDVARRTGNRPSDVVWNNGNRPGDVVWNNGNRPGDVVWRDWANPVRDHWHNHFHHDWFGDAWWDNHPHAHGWWNYHYGWNEYPQNYWWTSPAWAGLTTWFGDSGWSDSCLYDCGPGGNVVFQDNEVYINGEDICTAEQFAQSAVELATVAPPASEAEVESAQWLPLGVFAVSTSQQDTNPSRVLQLAVSKEGIISGTLYDTVTDKAETVQGQVDQQTQRVAFRIGDNQNLVAETGSYNLTQDETPLMVHFGSDRVEQYLLVRLDQPAEEPVGQM